MPTINVVKRNGSVEALDLNKIHRVVGEACKGVSGVSESLIELNANLQFYDGIKSKDIHETIIKSAAELIDEEPNYQQVAGRLVNYALRKEIYGSAKIPTMYEHLKRFENKNVYDDTLIHSYDDEEFKKIDKFIWHDRDYDIVFAGMDVFRSKYLVRNRVTGDLYETPQIAYMLISMSLFVNESKDKRLNLIKEFYDAISLHYISLPTPIMAGLRTPVKQFSSCTLIECGDSIDSICATTNAIVKYVSQRAGIGIGAGAIRNYKSPIRDGHAYHTGVVPFYKMFESAVNSCSQGGVRKGSGTLNYPIWLYEVENLLVLKNNKGSEDTRVRQLDYCVQLNKLFYERLINGGNITLFSPSEVPGLYDAFYSDQELFKTLYEKYEKNKSIRKKVVSAADLFNALAIERKNTGRIYIMNVDHANEHGSFISTKAPVRMTNLCVEINLSTMPLTLNGGGEIALCTLAALNFGKIKAPEDFEKYCYLTVRALDNLLDIQGYPMVQAENHTRRYRPLGVGIINFAYFLTKRGLKWGSTECLKTVHEYSEAWSYYLIKASIEVAKEKGKPENFENTKYSEGILPIDTYKKSVDTLLEPEYKMDWEALRTDLKEYGIRNTTLMALMPSETSSLVSNSTNGIEPPRALVSVKASKDGAIRQVVPEHRKYKNKYELLWDMKSPRPYLETLAVINKFIDQSISTNTSYNPEHYPDKQIPMSVLIGDILYAYKLGLKTLYYQNTYDGQKEFKDEETVENPIVSTIIEDIDQCDSCTI